MKRLFRYFDGYRKQLILGPIFKLTEAILELFVPLVMASIIDVGIANGDVRFIIGHGAVLLALGAVGLACALTCQYFAAVCAHGFGRSLRKDLYRHVFSLSEEQCGKIGTDSLITRLTNDVTQVQTGVNMFIRLAVRAPFLTIGSIVMAFTINAEIATIFLISTPLIILVLYLVTKKSLPQYTEIQKGQDAIARLAGENLEGARVIRAFSKQEDEIRDFRKAGDDLSAMTVRVGRLSALLNPVTSVIVNLAIAAIVWAGGRTAYSGGIEQGEIIALVNYMTQTLLALIVLANIIVVFTKALAGAKRISAVLETESSMQWTQENATAEQTADSIRFENVIFTYPNAGEKALEHLDFSLQKGQTLGIIGGTGCGKTTAARLLCRAYDVTEGAVLIDGVNVKEMRPDTLHQNISIVPQTARLFTGTVRSNLTLGSKEIKDEELWRALRIAQAAEFVQGKKGGLDEEVREGGKNFSGGQKQRLAIARAVAKNPQILILDDASSALDYATDAALRRALREETKEMTVVMISQRAAALEHADRILVLDDGCQCGFGTHEQLLKECSVYREICRSQGILQKEAAE